MSSRAIALAIGATLGGGAVIAARTVPTELRRIRPAVSALRRDVDAVATDSLPAVETNTRNLAGAVIPLAEDINAAEFPTLTSTVERLSHPLTELLGLIQRLELIQTAARGLDVLPRVDQTLVDVNGTVHALHDLLVAVNGQLSTSRQVQCETLKHIVSIDRKTGGPLPPDAQTSDPPPAGCRDVTR
jgi:hypothetical protein